MIEPGKLNALQPGQKRRKLALTLGALERDISGIAEIGAEYSFHSLPRAEYTRKIVEIVCADSAISEQARNDLALILQTVPFDEKRACNLARNAILAALGTFPAEWDLVIAPHEKAAEKRDFFPGLCVFAEDIRSPFNVGSIFRTAEAMGADKVFLSPLCTDPLQSKAIRSGMGCVETMGFERKSISELAEYAKNQNLPIFALETGGKSILEFEFPKKGICLLGSEELGLSPDALKIADYGTATIPLVGLKASLNVGVAFGILMQKWTESLLNQND